MTNEQAISLLLSKMVELTKAVNLGIDNSIVLIDNKQYIEAQEHLKNIRKVLTNLEFDLVIFLSKDNKEDGFSK